MQGKTGRVLQDHLTLQSSPVSLEALYLLVRPVKGTLAVFLGWTALPTGMESS
jgi:hypothetical protein